MALGQAGPIYKRSTNGISYTTDEVLYSVRKPGYGPVLDIDFTSGSIDFVFQGPGGDLDAYNFDRSVLAIDFTGGSAFLNGPLSARAITNSGFNGSVLAKWVSTNNTPLEPAPNGSLATVNNGTLGQVWLRDNGVWVQLGTVNGAGVPCGGAITNVDMWWTSDCNNPALAIRVYEDNDQVFSSRVDLAPSIRIQNRELVSSASAVNLSWEAKTLANGWSTDDLTVNGTLIVNGIVFNTGSVWSNHVFGATLVDFTTGVPTNAFAKSFTADRFTNRLGIVLGPSPIASTVLSNDVNGGIFTTTLGNTTNITVNGVRGPGSSVVNAQFMADGSMTFGGSITIPNGNRYQSGTRGYFDFAGDGYVRLLNNANGGPNNFIMGSGSGTSNGIGGLKVVNTIGGYTNLALKKLVLPNVTNPSMGTATLVNGTVTINNTEVTAQTIVMAGFKTVGGTTAGILNWSVSAGTSFTITSVSATGTTVATDTSDITYMLVENP